GIVVGWMIVKLFQGRRAILLCHLMIVQVIGALTTAISGTSLAFYLMASVSLTLGILIGALWIGSPGRATRIVVMQRIVGLRSVSTDALIITAGVMGVLVVAWLIEWFTELP